MNGDWDVLCFDSDRIVYDLAICDADGILLEKPSARTKVGIEITSPEFLNLGRKSLLSRKYLCCSIPQYP